MDGGGEVGSWEKVGQVSNGTTFYNLTPQGFGSVFSLKDNRLLRASNFHITISSPIIPSLKSCDGLLHLKPIPM